MFFNKSQFRIIRLNIYILIFFALLLIAFKTGLFESQVGSDNLTDKVYAKRKSPPEKKHGSLRDKRPSPPAADDSTNRFKPVVQRRKNTWRKNRRPNNKSDLNRDGLVNIEDVALFSSRWLKKDWQTVDWCQWLSEDGKRKKHLGDELRDFISTWFKCRIKNPNNYPTRLAFGPDGKLFVSDAKIGSVFVYDTGLNIIDEIEGIDTPLGIAVDNAGNIYVGSDGSDTVKVYNPKGKYIKSIGNVGMPNDMVFDRSGNLYVADSVNNKIIVYDPKGRNIRNIATDIPVSLAISSYYYSNSQEIGELFVAEMKLAKISVFDLQGNYLRSFGRKVSSFGSFWYGRFVKLQSLAVDSQGRVHALDCYLNKVQILDAQNGTFLASYPAGEQPDHTNLFLDIVLKDPGTSLLTNSENKRIEIFQY